MRRTEILARWELLVGAVALGFLVVLGLIPDGATRIHTWPWVFYSHLLLLAPMVLLGQSLARSPRSFPLSVWAVFAVSVAIGISVGGARLPLFSLEASLVLWGGLALLALCLVRADDLRSALQQARYRRIAGLILVAPIIASTAYWLRNLSIVASTWGWHHVFQNLSGYRNPYSFGHSNYTAGYALLCLPWMIALFWTERTLWRAAWFVLAAMTGVNLFSSFSRGGVLAAVAMIGAFALVYVLTSRIGRPRKLMLLLGMLAVGAILVGSNPRMKDIALRRHTGFDPNVGDVQRLGMLEGGLLLARERPLTGHGPGMTPFVYPAVRARVVGGVETSFQLHNAPLQIFVDVGLLGCMALGCLLALLFFSGWRLLKAHDDSPGTRALRLASAYSLFGYIVYSLSDYQLNVPSITAVLSFHAAFVLQPERPAPTPEIAASPVNPPTRRTVGFIVIGLVGLLLWPLSQEWRARHEFWAAWWDTPSSDIKGLLAHLNKASEIQPWNPFYKKALGLQFAEESQRIKDPRLSGTLHQLAKVELSKSLTLLPTQEPVEAALGWLLLASDPQQAASHFRAALKLIPDRDTLHFGLALCRLAQKNDAEVVQQLALECLVNPRFVASAFWYRAPFDAYRNRNQAALMHLLDEAEQSPLTPAWRKPSLRFLRAWARWWEGGAVPQDAELHGATPEQRAFFDALAREQQTHIRPNPSDFQYPLRTVVAAWETETDLSALNRRSPRRLSEDALDGARARLETKPATLSDLLRLPAPDNKGAKMQPVYRLHYSIMERNLDGPGTLDLAPRLNDAFDSEVLGELFPAAGLVPGSVLEQLDKSP